MMSNKRPAEGFKRNKSLVLSVITLIITRNLYFSRYVAVFLGNLALWVAEKFKIQAKDES